MYSTVTKKSKQRQLTAGSLLSGFHLARCEILSSDNIFKFFIKHILNPNNPSNQIKPVNQGFSNPRMQGRGWVCGRSSEGIRSKATSKESPAGRRPHSSRAILVPVLWPEIQESSLRPSGHGELWAPAEGTVLPGSWAQTLQRQRPEAQAPKPKRGASGEPHPTTGCGFLKIHIPNPKMLAPQSCTRTYGHLCVLREHNYIHENICK